MKTLIFTFVSLLGTNCFATEWIPYMPQVQTTTAITQPTVVYQQAVPQVYYQWIPYIVNQPVVTERRCLIFKRTVVENVPVIQWVYQPMVLQ